MQKSQLQQDTYTEQLKAGNIRFIEGRHLKGDEGVAAEDKHEELPEESRFFGGQVRGGAHHKGSAIHATRTQKQNNCNFTTQLI